MAALSGKPLALARTLTTPLQLALALPLTLTLAPTLALALALPFTPALTLALTPYPGKLRVGDLLYPYP